MNKYWVIAVSGQLDSHLVQEIETISGKNKGYRFIIVSPVKINH